MVAYKVDDKGICSSCSNKVKDREIVQCYDCKIYFHGICGEVTPYCNKTFLSSFKKVRCSNFIFVCDMCITKRENLEASSINDQIAALTETVSKLATEFQSFKAENVAVPVQVTEEVHRLPWSNPAQVERMKASLCIKSNGVPVNIEKVQEIAITNSIQVSKTIVKDNGDVYVDLPSRENRDKLTPLLTHDTFTGNEIVNIKSKLPTISILNVTSFTSKEELVEKVKRQNPLIKEKIENGSEFSIVFFKKPREDESDGKNKYFQVVARVGEDIRRVVKMSDNKIFMDLVAHPVVDRFFIKRCNKCQKFGHYQKDCNSEPCCGYCRKPHLSTECDQVQAGDYDHYECINCVRD